MFEFLRSWKQPKPMSRREINLLCDNAALTSALEQKERARVAAVEVGQRLQRALDDAHRENEGQVATLAQSKAVYRVCYVDGQGYGYMDPPGWARVPEWARARVQVLTLCQSERIAQWIVRTLPRDWRDSETQYNLWTGETRWAIDG